MHGVSSWPIGPQPIDSEVAKIGWSFNLKLLIFRDRHTLLETAAKKNIDMKKNEISSINTS